MNETAPATTAPATPDQISLGGAVSTASWKQALRQPVYVAAFFLGLGVVAFVWYLERGKVNVELPPPQVRYELLPNQGLTEGVPIAIKVNQASVFQIDDPMQGGTAARAKEVVAAVEAAVQDLVREPGRIVTIDFDSASLPAIVQNNVDGSGRRVLVQITEGDVTLSGQSDVKWLARNWAERVTDAFKLFVFGEPPQFSIAYPFGEALNELYAEALEERGAISLGALNRAFDNLPVDRQSALTSFPPPPPPDPNTPGLRR